MNRLVRAAAIAVLAAFSTAASHAAPTEAGLPGSRASLFKAVAAPKVSPPEALVAASAVAVDVGALTDAGPGGLVDLVLPSGVAFTLTVDKLERTGAGRLSWSAHAGSRAYRAYGASGPGGTYARFETPEGTWGLMPSQDGHDWLFDASATEWNLRGAYGDDALPPPAHLVNKGQPLPKATGDPVCADVPSMPAGPVTIDVLAVVTNGFRASHGEANVATRLDFLFNAINGYYAASNIAITLRRVGLVNVTVNEADGDSAMLNAVTDGTGAFANVAALRTLTGADMVAVFRNTGSQNSISGVAWVGGFGRNPMSFYADSMFSINGDSPLFSGTLVAHELGHNMGNFHDRANAGSGLGATSYSFGHVNCGDGFLSNNNPVACPTTPGFNTMRTGWGTIMAYYRPTIAKFANPYLTCTRSGGASGPCGVADNPAANPATTNTGSDTVRAMNCVRATIATFLPDNQGCADASDADGDGIPACVEPRVLRSAGAKDNDIFTQPQLFVMQQYRDFLNREADADGLNGWMSLIASGTSREAVVNAFFNSAEFNGFVAPIVRLYYATFLRVPDYGGLTFNAGLVRNGSLTLLQLADFFTVSPEFAATYGALDNTAFVTLLYNNVLGRAPDPGGLSGWVGLLNGGMSRGQVLVGFSESTEYRIAKFNEVYVSMMYVGKLRRSPEPGGYNGWLAYLQGGNTPLNMISGFYNSTEYRNRFLP